MRLNEFTKQRLNVKRWLTTIALCVAAIAFVWQGAPFWTPAALANDATLIAADVGDQIQDKTSKDAGRAKGFIRDTADKVERTAKKNASRVDRATEDGSYVERKAKRDAGRIQQRSEEDAARTQKAVDNTKNVIERAVDNVKDALSN